MEVIAATDYGHRKVIRCVIDAPIPEWVHADGSAHTADTARGPSSFGTDGAEEPGERDRSLAAGTECHACRYNWQVREFIFSRQEYTKVDAQGNVVNLSDDELLAEITTRMATPAPPANLAALVGRTLGA